MKSTLFAAALVVVLSAANVQAATYTQTGVKNDVSYSEVINGGWQLVSQSNYASSLSINDLFAGLSRDSKVMIGAMKHGSGVLDVLAGATLSDIITYTAQNQTHAANGVEWYFNGLSMGFAELGKSIDQNSADVAGISERDRLSWHTSLAPNTWDQHADLSPLFVFKGWRSGDNTGLNASADWDRVVFTSAVPEPATYAMLLAGLGLAGTLARRRRKA